MIFFRSLASLPSILPLLTESPIATGPCYPASSIFFHRVKLHAENDVTSCICSAPYQIVYSRPSFLLAAHKACFVITRSRRPPLARCNQAYHALCCAYSLCHTGAALLFLSSAISYNLGRVIHLILCAIISVPIQSILCAATYLNFRFSSLWSHMKQPGTRRVPVFAVLAVFFAVAPLCVKGFGVSVNFFWHLMA